MALTAEAGDDIERADYIENDSKAQHDDCCAIVYPGQHGINGFFKGLMIYLFCLPRRL
jgi:hypothetical protein